MKRLSQRAQQSNPACIADSLPARYMLRQGQAVFSRCTGAGYVHHVLSHHHERCVACVFLLLDV